MEKENIKIENGMVAIKDLIGQSFFVDSYQRGYRWTEKEVNDLLDDFDKFSNRPEGQDFYCLQPVVVRKSKDTEGTSWELIDGQQRLTTIHLILKAIEEKNFSITYKTRYENVDFLKELNKESIGQSWDAYVKKYPDHDHIDHYHLFTAYKTVSNFSISDHFLKSWKEKTKVIWYEIPEEKIGLEDPRTVFTRINGGKISLTQAELLKAWFIQKEGAKGYEVAIKWEEMERQLRVPEYRYFLTGTAGDKAPNAISILLEDLASATTGTEKGNVFRSLTEDYQGKEKSISFSEIEELFNATKLWYSDSQLYNLIGWLRAISGNTLSTIMKLNSHGKNDLKEKIQVKIQETIKTARLSSLTYGESNDHIKTVLFSFNMLAHCGPELRQRFPFHLYRTTPSWHLEHIHALATESPDTTDTMRTWLRNFKESVGPFKELKNNIVNEKEVEYVLIQIETLEIELLNGAEAKKKATKFIDIQNLVKKILGFEGEENSIKNLALLDSKTNISISNSPFNEKREAIIEAADSGTFLLPATLRVFLKFYSKGNINGLIWGRDDRDNYEKAMDDAFNKFKTLTFKK